MFDHLFTDAQRRARDQARAFVKDTPRELILDMDAEKVRSPKAGCARRQATDCSACAIR